MNTHRWLTQSLRAGSALGLLGLGMLSLPAAAETSFSLSLEQMTRKAGTVVVSRVTDVRVAPHPQYQNLPVTYVTLRVAEAWKGAPEREVTFMQFGNATDAGPGAAKSVKGRAAIRFHDLPTYARGQEVLLFLRRPSRAGLTSPVGGNAGKLIIRRDAATGKAMIQSQRTGSARVAAPGGEWVSLDSLRRRVAGTVRLEAQGR
jgi:hypothetical protein